MDREKGGRTRTRIQVEGFPAGFPAKPRIKSVVGKARTRIKSGVGSAKLTLGTVYLRPRDR